MTKPPATIGPDMPAQETPPRLIMVTHCHTTHPRWSTPPQTIPPQSTIDKPPLHIPFLHGVPSTNHHISTNQSSTEYPRLTTTLHNSLPMFSIGARSEPRVDVPSVQAFSKARGIPMALASSGGSCRGTHACPRGIFPVWRRKGR